MHYDLKETLDTILVHLTSLEQLNLLFQITCQSLRSIHHNKTITKLMTEGFRSPPGDVARELKNLFTANKTPESFRIVCDKDPSGQRSAAKTLANVISDDKCTLQEICIKSKRLSHELHLSLFEAIQTSKTLTTLWLPYNGLLTTEFWDMLRAVILENKTLTRLWLGLLDLSDTDNRLDEFATALCQNHVLTEVVVGNRWSVASTVGRLFCRRNQIRKMVKHNLVPEAIWAPMIHSLAPNPSAIFLAMQYFPCREDYAKQNCTK